MCVPNLSRKMQWMFVALFMISVTSGRELSWLPKNLIDKTEIFNWSERMFEMIDRHQNTSDININRRMLQNVLRSEHQLYSLTNHDHMKCDQILNALLLNITSGSINIPEADLCPSINRVHRFFTESRKYGIVAVFSDQTLLEFGHRVLWDDVNLPDSLEDIRESLISDRYSSGLLELIYEYITQNLYRTCDTHASTQQLIYSMYVQLIISELEGFLTLQQVYLTKRFLSGLSHNYVAELDYVKRNFKSRVEQYHNTFIREIDRFPQSVRRCEVEIPRYGYNIIELKNFSRVSFLHEKVSEPMKCYSCSDLLELESYSLLSPNTIYNCTEMGSTVTACPAEPGSNRDYSWWTDSHGVQYGRNTTCKQTKIVQRSESQYCVVCACSMDQNRTGDDPTNESIWKISVMDQISNMANDMVVTGLRFVVQDNALHLQIHESNSLYSGLISNKSNWIQLHHSNSNEILITENSQDAFVSLTHNRKTLYLDDIKVPKDNVVVGVKFQPVGDSAFELQVMGAPFDFQTGTLDPSGAAWYDASTNPFRPKDYEHKRLVIDLANSDEPTVAKGFEYDLTSNKMVTFTHTDIHKDAGQTTIPLFHAEPVMTKPPFPLSGIGLSFSGKDGFGGYVAPRIYTIKVSNYMSAP